MRNEGSTNPLASIIIPVYNGAEYLRDSIGSALAQAYENIEVIVVNDGSIDDTEKIARSYGDKIRYFAKKNGGVSSALNLGLREMKGEYFSWLSHDDLLLPNKIKRQMEFLKTLKDKNVILYSDFEFINKNGGRIKTMKLDHKMLMFKPEYSLFRGCVNGNTLLIPRRAFDEHGSFDKNLRCTQDYAKWFDVMKTYKFIHIPAVLAKYRIHQSQTSNISPDVAAEGDALWIGMMEKLSFEVRKRLEKSELEFYKKMVFYLKRTPYKKAMEFANKKANEILSNENKSAVDFTKVFIWPDRRELQDKIRFITLSPLKFLKKYLG